MSYNLRNSTAFVSIQDLFTITIQEEEDKIKLKQEEEEFLKEQERKEKLKEEKRKLREEQARKQQVCIRSRMKLTPTVFLKFNNYLSVFVAWKMKYLLVKSQVFVWFLNISCIYQKAVFTLACKHV